MKVFLRFRAAAAALPLLLILAGCLADPIDGPEVKPRTVTAPPRVWFFATNYVAPTTGDLVVRWNHAASDTQQNFKGYHVTLYRSDTTGFDDTLSGVVAIDSAIKHGNKVDTSVTFHNIPMRRYTAYVRGIQYGDTLVLSRDSVGWSNWFDPRPLMNPTNLRATSLGAQDVRIEWDVPATDTNSGLKYYQVYYNDPTRLDSAFTGPTVAHRLGATHLDARLLNLPTYPQQGGNSSPQRERPFRFWVKAVRTDDIQFSTDSSTILWAGAPRVPLFPDSGGVYAHALLFVQYSSGATLVDDSVDNTYQLNLSFSGSSVTLTAANGAKLSDRVDTATSLDTITYAAPVTTGFTQSAITLDASAPGAGGVILYLQFPDNQSRLQYARIWIKQQADGPFVTSRPAIVAKASWQTGMSVDGRQYLPYY